MAVVWNFLVFDDDPEILEILVEELEEPGFLGDDIICCRTVNNFASAQKYVETGNFDLVILDLQDETADAAVDMKNSDKFSGERVLDSLKDKQFIPVIFNTGYADKITHLQSKFVKVVTKGSGEDLKLAIQETFSTKLPKLIRYIQEEQRKYLWDHVETHWGDASELNEDGEVAYLLARRLANSLSMRSIKRFFDPSHDGPSKVHPVEYYVWPPLASGVVLGDIYFSEEDKSFYLVINPACDFEQGKADTVLLVRCKLLSDFPEFSQLEKILADGKSIGSGKRKELIALVSDNRKSVGGQPERYKYLPGTSFLPHLVADFQILKHYGHGAFLLSAVMRKVATLDSPFAEGVQAKFSRYYGRFGMPDLNSELVAANIIDSIGVSG
ncbi:hypothetical protein V2J97_25275 [Pseudomonas alliivorans]|nr:hypothetical protein [Pseudomonas alliivorans]